MNEFEQNIPNADSESTVSVAAESIPAHVESPYVTAPVKKKKNYLWGILGVCIVAVCVVTTAFSVIWAAKGNRAYQLPVVSTPQYNFVAQKTSSDLLDVPGVIKKVKPSVVTVMVTLQNTQNSIYSEYFGGSSPYSTGYGTGVIFSEDGYILTCAHVVEGATSVRVTTYDDKEYSATIVGMDTYSDIAVLKVDATGLVAAEFADSDQVVEGEAVVAMGTPYDPSLAYTSTNGIVSAIRYNYNFEELDVTLDLFQHTAAINSGNSGGPLLNMYGQVIGINSIKISGDYENLGFAIQLNSVKGVIESLINVGRVDRPVIGISGQTSSSSIGGVDVVDVVKGGAADLAGMKPGDLITKFNGQRVKSITELINFIGKCNVGDEVEVTVIRDDGESYNLKMTLQANTAEG